MAGKKLTDPGIFFIVALVGVAAVVMAGTKIPNLNEPDENGRTPLEKLFAAGGLLAALPLVGGVLARAIAGTWLAWIWPLTLAAGILYYTGALGWVADALGLGKWGEALAHFFHQVGEQGTRIGFGSSDYSNNPPSSGGSGGGGWGGGGECPAGQSIKLVIGADGRGRYECR